MAAQSVVHARLRAREADPRSAASHVELRRLDWDSAFFGEPMGTLVLERPGGSGDDPVEPTSRAHQIEQDLRRALARAHAAGYAHLILRVPASDLPAAWAAERAGLTLVDVGIDSSLRMGASPPPAPSDLRIRALQAGDVAELREIAADSFRLSRFSADPFFSPEQVHEFHREWVKNLCGGLAQQVLVCELTGVLAGTLAGFASCSIRQGEGRIPLIATRAAYRKRGVGRSLLAAAIRWFADAGARVVHVKTQAHNYSALALYHRTGFVISSSELTFSVTLRATGQR